MKTNQSFQLRKRNIVFWFFLLLLANQVVYSQSESNDMITYDSSANYVPAVIINGQPAKFLLRITRPRNYFTAGSPDTASRPAIFMMPGTDETGTNPANLVKFGPHYWMNNGWNGAVQLGNGTHYPIFITIVQGSDNTGGYYSVNLFDSLIKWYHLKLGSIHVSGLSHGSTFMGDMIAYARSSGDTHAMSQIKSWVAMQSLGGSADGNQSIYNIPFPQCFQTWATNYGGRVFAIEGTQDYRASQTLTEPMNAAVPNSAYLTYENDGGGTHCCWNDFYNPSVSSWQNLTAPYGNPYITTGPYSNTKGTYIGTGNIYTWMLRQGDTSLVGGTASMAPTVSVGSNQSIQLPTNSLTVTASATANGGHTIASTTWSKTSGPSTFTIGSPSSMSTSISGLVTGSYVFTFTATDNAGQVTTSSITVTVLGTTPPTVGAGTNQTITLPTSTVTLTGTATGNAGATITSTTWSETSGPNTATITSPSALTTTITGLIQGTYVFTLSATDNSSNTTTANVTVTVNGAPAPPGPKTIMGIGEYQAFLLDQNGHVFGIGTNLSTIGTSNLGTPGLPIPIAVKPSNLQFVSVAASLHGGLAADANGYVWCWGDGSAGQMGDGNIYPSTVATPVKILTDSLGNPFTGVTQVLSYFSANEDAGNYAIKSDGTLWIWGPTKDGMRGDGSFGGITTRPVQIPIPGNRKVIQAVAGNELFVLCSDGTVWASGGATNGVPGLPANLGYAATGNSYLTLHQLTQLSGIKQIAGGLAWNYALKADGTLYGWGSLGSYMGNADGTSLYVPTVLTNISSNLPSPVTSIVTNSNCTHAILADGSLWGWGDNAQGNIGNGAELNYFTTTAPFTWDFKVGDLLQRLPARITTRNDFVAVFGSSVFTFYTYAVTADNTLYSWGRNKGGVLGNGVTTCSPNIASAYPNSWDVPLATIVTPFQLKSVTVVPSPYCVANPGGSPCNQCGVVKNIGPVANAGPSQTITLPTNTIVLNGNKSYDPDGTITAYAWVQVSGPATSTINSTYSVSSTVNGLVAGTYIFSLLVSDNLGASGMAFDTIVVNPVGGNQAPTVNAGSNQTIVLPINSVTLTGTATGNGGATIASITWAQASGPNTATIATASNLTTNVTGLIQGVYTFQLLVTDSKGISNTSIVTITVNAPNPPPTVSAGSAQIITLPVNSVTLTGKATPNGGATIASTIWSQNSGPNTATISSPSNLSTTVTGLVAGVYVFKLTATDNKGLSNTATVTITVNAAANVPPTVNAGSNQTITLPTSTVTLTGTATGNNGATISSTSWVESSGPNTASISSASNLSTAITGLIAGVYTFELSATDNNGLSNTATITVTVNAANVPPNVNAGTAQTITLPVNTVTLSGAATGNNGATITSTSWTQVSGPNTAGITSSSNLSTAITGLIAGTYKFKLTAIDNNGLSNSATVTITVNAAADIPPTVDAGSDQTITLPTNSVTLAGTASGNNGATISTISWIETGGPSTAVITTPDNLSTTVTGLVAGQYTFDLTVTDNNGLSSTSSVTITVNAANVPPNVGAGGAQTITLPTNTATLSGTASGNNGATITSTSWSQVSGPNTAGIISSSNLSTAITGLITGTYKFKLTATDNNGLSNSATVTITVNAAAKIPPTVDAGTDQIIILPTNSVVLNGTASGNNGATITTITWSQASGPDVATIASPSNLSTSINGLSEGVYTFQLLVTDNNGLSNESTVTITVNAANVAPNVNAGSPQSITLPNNTITLQGSASGNNGATIVSTTWAEVSGPNTATIADPTNLNTNVSGLILGVYTFRLSATDNNGLSNTATVTVTVNATANQAPIANAGPDKTITLPTNSVGLDGSRSYDPDGTIASYSWGKVSGPGAATIINSNTATPTVTGLQAGQYVFQLTVTDNAGLTASDVTTVTVNSTNNNLLLTANAGQDTTIALPADSAILNGSASIGSITSYQWLQISGPSTANIYSSSNAVSMVSSLIAGQYIFQLTVVDNAGNRSTANVKVNVVNDLRYTDQVVIYPNPAHDIINLRLVSDSIGKVRVTVFDMNGRLVLTSEFEKTQSYLDQSMNVSQLAKGVYVIQTIIGSRQTILVTKLVKQ